MARACGLSSWPRPACVVLFSREISRLTTWTRASRAIGSLGYFSASSRNRSGNLSTLPSILFRSSSVFAREKTSCDAAWYSFRSALYCSAGVAGLPRASWPAASGGPSARARIPPTTMRLTEASSALERDATAGERVDFTDAATSRPIVARVLAKSSEKLAQANGVPGGTGQVAASAAPALRETQTDVLRVLPADREALTDYTPCCWRRAA